MYILILFCIYVDIFDLIHINIKGGYSLCIVRSLIDVLSQFEIFSNSYVNSLTRLRSSNTLGVDLLSKTAKWHCAASPFIQ